MKHLRKIIYGITTAALLVATFTTSTYAWLNFSAKAEVSGFSFTATSGLGFQISIDNEHYKSRLTANEVKYSMLMSFRPDVYSLDETGEKLYKVNELGQKVEMTIEEVNQDITDNIQLLPVTTKNGRDFTNLFEGKTYVSDGKYLEFYVYFRTTSRLASDGLTYDIYLNGEDKVGDGGEVLSPVSITSATTLVPLRADMNTIGYDPVTHEKSLRNLTRGEDIEVYSSNALRFSTTESANMVTKDGSGNPIYELDDQNNPKLDEQGNPIPVMAYQTVEDSSLIFELNDTEHLYKDLGSYASNYDESTSPYSEKYYLYSSNCNAMYTYYNRLKTKAPLTSRLPDYESLPTTIKSLTNKDDAGNLIYDKITTLSSGEDAKKVTFRFWLEGWDADCFDGLTNNISVGLSFGSKKIN